MNTRQGKRKAYVKLETAVIVISENESLLGWIRHQYRR